MYTQKFVFAKVGVPNGNGEIFTKEALYHLQEKICKDKKIQLKDRKGTYEAAVYHCYLEGSALMLEVQIR